MTAFRVLLVDDDSTNREVFQLLISDLGYECDVAVDGARALDAMQKTRYDLVFMDYLMPGMDGCQTTMKIRQNEAVGGRRSTVIALTAHESQADRDKCLSAGMDDYLTKPFKLSELADMLAKWDKPINPRIAKDLRQTAGEERFHAMAATFVANTRSEFADVRAAVEADDRAGAKDRVHTLKGKTGMFGATRLQSMVIELEKLIMESGPKPALLAVVDQCEDELRKYEEAARS